MSIMLRFSAEPDRSGELLAEAGSSGSERRPAWAALFDEDTDLKGRDEAAMLASRAEIALEVADEEV